MLGQKITFGSTDSDYWVFALMYDADIYYITSEEDNVDTFDGWMKVSRSGTSDTFTIEFDATINGDRVRGNYKGNLIEKDSYFGFGA